MEEIASNAMKISELSIPPVEYSSNLADGREQDLAEKIQSLRKRVRAVMFQYGGIVRTNDGLEEGLMHLDMIEREATVEGLLNGANIVKETIELKNLLEVGKLVLYAAKQRKESRGLHYNADFAESRETENHDTILNKRALKMR